MLALIVVPVESTLNAVWMFLGLIAVGAALIAARAAGAAPRRKLLQVLCVGIIVAALFPYISVTDDALRIQHFSPANQSQETGKHSPNDTLLRLYEVMDAPLAVAVYTLVLTLFFLAVVAPAVRATVELALPRSAGRSPPAV